MARLALAVFLFSVSALSACGQDESRGTETGNGVVRVDLVDAPGDFEAVLVTVTRVEAHSPMRAGTGTAAAGREAAWITLADQEATHDLLALRNGASAVLGERAVPAARYTQIRLMVSRAQVRVDGVLEELTIPSASVTGIKLSYDFTVEADRTHRLVLDFDAEASIKGTPGGYRLEPVITVQSFTEGG